MTAPLADDFAYIRSRLAELEGKPQEAEQPKAWPDFTPVDTAYSPEAVTETIWGHYSAPDQDCAWSSDFVMPDGIVWRRLGASKDEKIDAQLRIRLPADYLSLEGPAIDWACG